MVVCLEKIDGTKRFCWFLVQDSMGTEETLGRGGVQFLCRSPDCSIISSGAVTFIMLLLAEYHSFNYPTRYANLLALMMYKI